MQFTFFPGCSLKASGHENTLSLLKFCELVNIELTELEDWNCCGSSSAHSIDLDLAEKLPMRNISLAPKGVSLLIACPSCFVRMKSMYLKLKSDKQLRQKYEDLWGKSFDETLEIIPFFEIFNRIDIKDNIERPKEKLKQLKVAPYYGCMLAMPPDLRFEKSYAGVLEKTLGALGADVICFGYGTRCCGTYLSVAKPRVAQKVVNEIIFKAMEAGAECMVTACAMCHLNLEIRCSLENPIPILHFSELLSMALGEADRKKWFPRHIVNPVPLLKKRGLISS
ncbi:CoB--CoM heterodisulfide reductase iron-sulfur subunit B family protein [Desulfobacula phenolica]|uniref:Heterodisulfide reductase subunit B n=1 Tax=Desulfobacula phenolica TaxID=90732 RepID=A0A1H2JAI8_9BACT|nr:heterodisulfide reductase-related iron-sulfur binding cluster [Desulfobacula phenolica]SDU53430.1 heterodisulfide reductase subunit B [Desulfobacula phenolica]